jgi:hypothetical protein
MTACNSLADIDKFRTDDAWFIEWDVELHRADLLRRTKTLAAAGGK